MKPHFYLNSRQKKDGEHAVMLRYYSHGKPSTIFLSFISVRPKFWSAGKEKCLISNEWPQGRNINAMLSQIMEVTELVCLEAMQTGGNEVWIKEQIQQRIDAMLGIRPKRIELIEAIELYIKHNPKGIKKGTMAKYTTLKTKLELYSKESKHNIMYESITLKFADEFCRWMESKEYLNDTIQKALANLKSIMKWALEAGYHNSHSFSKIKVRASQNNDTVFLYPQELEILSNADFDVMKPIEPTKHWGMHIATIKNARDVFCFACYTGQRYSDIKNLKWTDLVNSSDGMEWHIYQVKGNKTNKVIVPLGSKAIRILERQVKGHKNVFYTASGQKYNDSLKEMARLCGLDRNITTVRYSGKNRIETTEPLYEAISSHKARSTFVTLLKSLKVPDKVIMEMTGHTDVRTMMRYHGVSQQAKREALNDVFGD